MEIERSLAARLAALEQRMAELADSVEELKDLGLVNKLDIINLNAAVERGRLAEPEPQEAERIEQALAGLEAEIAELRGQRPEPEPAKAPAAVNACAQCRRPLRPGARFCGGCGALASPPHLPYRASQGSREPADVGAAPKGHEARARVKRRKR